MKILLLVLLYSCLIIAENDFDSLKEIPDSSFLEYSNDDIILSTEEEDKKIGEDTLPPIETMPELLTRIEPDYPEEMYKKGIQGTVLINLIVNENGRVDSVAVVQGVHPVLDSNVVTAARQFVFSPAIAGGEPVAVLIQYEKIFSLREIVEKIDQYINFKGSLVEKGTRTPIPDAMVVLHFLDSMSIKKTINVPFSAYLYRLGEFEGQFLEENRLVTITDSNGNFEFHSLPTGKVEVSIPIPGYEEFREIEQINPAEEIRVTYFIQRVSYSEYEIVVYGSMEKKEISRRKLTIHEVQKIPGFGGDAVKVVQSLPGVARPTFGAAQIIVRGAPTQDSKFFLDGVEIPILFHYGLKSTYNSEALESVDFYPGGFGSRYGAAIAGVVELTGRKANTDRWHGHTDENFIDGSFLVEGPVTKNVSLLATARRSFIGDLIKFAAKNSPPTTTIMTVAPFYWDYLVRTDMEILKELNAYVSFFGVKEQMKIVSSDVRGGTKDVDDANNAFGMKYIFNMGIFGLDWDMSDKIKNNLRYSLTYGDYGYSAFGFEKMNMFYFQNYFRNQVTILPNKRLAVNIGIDATLTPYDFIFTTIDGENTVSRERTYDWLFGDVGGYVIVEWKPVDNFQFIPSFRYDYYPELHYNGAIVPEFTKYKDFDNTGRFSADPSLRVTSRYEFIKNHTMKFAIGNYNQTPKPLGETIHKKWGDPNLSVTRAAHYVLGYEWQITDLIHLDLQGYFNKQFNVPRYQTELELGQTTLWLNDGKRRMRGLELMLRHEQGNHFFGWLAYSLSKSERYDHKEHAYVLFGKDQTHNVIAVCSWRLPKNWEVGFKFQHTTGDPETPIIGAIYNEDTHRWELKYGKKSSQRIPPHSQLDLRFDKKIILKKSIISAYIDFFNIGYFLYKSPQFTMYNGAEPFDFKLNKANKRYIYQYSIPSIGLKMEF